MTSDQSNASLVAAPSVEEVLAYDGDATFVVLAARLHADIDTPITAFAKLASNAPLAFLLESAESGGQFGRWSFMGSHVAARLVLRDGVATLDEAGQRSEEPFSDPLMAIRKTLQKRRTWQSSQLPPFAGGAVGYVGFDCLRYFEPVPLPEGEGLALPEAALLFCDEVHAYDHLRHQIVSMVHVSLQGDARQRSNAYRQGLKRLEQAQRTLLRPSGLRRYRWPVDGGPDIDHLLRVNRSAEDMRSAVSKARERIGDGEVFQVVASQRVTASADVDPFVLYRALRALNPSPYMFLLRLDGFSLVGASPEVLVRCQGGELLVRPIAGTRRRGRDEGEDRALAAELLNDEKERAEHSMLVDLGRNDVGRVAKLGTVEVRAPMHIERYSHVMHMVSDVRGELADGLDMFDALRAGFPAGTVSGAPKVRACELLAELEPDRRGPYAGAVGYFGSNGDMDTAIAIRTLVVKAGEVSVQAGAGIVWDSDPERERVECLHKARGPLAAVRLALAVQQRRAEGPQCPREVA